MSRDYADFVIDALADWAKVSARRMFGGFGVFRDGLMFALIIDDTLYFKVDADHRAVYEQAGSSPFVYHARGKPVVLSYWQVPLEVFEDSDDLAAWAQKAFLTAIRARKQPAEKRKKPETRPESGKTRRKPAAS